MQQEFPYDDKEATTSRPGMQQNRLFAGLFLSRLPKSYTGATAVLVDELDTGGFQGTANGQVVRCGHRGFLNGEFGPPNGRNTDRGFTGEILSAPPH